MSASHPSDSLATTQDDALPDAVSEEAAKRTVKLFAAALCRAAVSRRPPSLQSGGLSDGDVADDHDKIAARVYRRLCFRHAQLSLLDDLTRFHQVHEELSNGHANPKGAPVSEPQEGVVEAPPQAPAEAPAARNPTPAQREDSKPGGQSTPQERAIPAGVRAYRLAVTDLFVEKALTYLEDQAAIYKSRGTAVYGFAFLFIIAGTGIATWKLFSHDPIDNWMNLAASFARAFTAYGMIVLTAVFLTRFARALLDQAERLLERRHALRQGRLFVHLNDGRLTVEQMDKAFNWNVSQSNAFGNMPTDASAPWGAVLKEFAQNLPDLLSQQVQLVNALKNEKSSGDGRKK